MLACLTGFGASARAAAPPPHANSIAIDGSEPSVSQITNAYLRVDADDDGQFVISTTGGDPDLNDDNRSLTYIYFPQTGANVWSSETWVRIVDGQNAATVPLAGRIPSFGPLADNGKINTTWVVSDVQIRQTLSFMTNPFTGRDDLVNIDYETRNLGDSTRSIGMRMLVDVLVGGNDLAPYFVSGSGRFTTTQIFTDSATMPSYFLSFESPTFDPSGLRAMGLLGGYGLSRPDALSIGSLSGIRTRFGEAPAIIVNDPIGDSAYGIVWNPRPIGVNAITRFSTAYGLSGRGGGASWLVSPAQIRTGQVFEFEIQAWINNASASPYTNGVAVLRLPDGLSLLSGETQTKPIRQVGANDAALLVWRVRIDDPEKVASYGYSVQTTFANGVEAFNASGTTVVGELTKRVLLPLLSR